MEFVFCKRKVSLVWSKRSPVVLHWKSEISIRFSKTFCFSTTQACSPICKCISPLWGKTRLIFIPKSQVWGISSPWVLALPTTAGVGFPPRCAPKSRPHWAVYRHHEISPWLLPERPGWVKSKTQEIVSMWKQLCLYYSAKHEVLNRPWVEMTARLKVGKTCIEHAQE